MGYDEIMASKAFLPYRMGYLTDWMVKKAKDELNETEKDRGTALEELRSLIAKDTDLKCWTDDAYLLQFLRCRKFKVKKAYERLKQFYTVKKNFSEVYPENLDVDTLRNFLLESGAASYMPYRDDNGCVVMLFKISRWDPDKYSFQFIASMMTAIILNPVEDPATQVCGIQILLDVESVSLAQIRAITPRYVKLLSYALRNTLPVRLMGIHVFNESVVFGYLFGVLKLFLTEKIKKRFHFHGASTEQLHQYIPKEILPAEYGGDNKNFNAIERVEKEMESFYERFAEMHRKGYS